MYRSGLRVIAPMLFVVAMLPHRASANPPPDSAFQSITVDLNARSIADVVPFDVPFALTGAADVTLQRVDAWYTQTDKSRRCTAVDVPSTSAAAIDQYYENLPKAGKREPLTVQVGGYTFTHVDTWQPVVTPAPTSWRLNAPELKSSRYYYCPGKC